MRRIVSLVVALFVTVGGAGVFHYLVLFAPAFYGWVLAGSATMTAVGAMWLYADLTDVAPNESA
jgi:hypothetical protein